jgi:hypothetical protein
MIFVVSVRPSHICQSRCLNARTLDGSLMEFYIGKFY